MGQNFISCDREQVLLLPPSLTDWLPEHHLVWSVLGAVDHMNLDRLVPDLRKRRSGFLELACGHPARDAQRSRCGRCSDLRCVWPTRQRHDARRDDLGPSADEAIPGGSKRCRWWPRATGRSSAASSAPAGGLARSPNSSFVDAPACTLIFGNDAGNFESWSLTLSYPGVNGWSPSTSSAVTLHALARDHRPVLAALPQRGVTEVAATIPSGAGPGPILAEVRFPSGGASGADSCPRYFSTIGIGR
jgi:hypothetical protein